MGKKELAQYICTSCGETFSYDAARTILEGSEPPKEIDAGRASVYRDESKTPEESRR